MRSRASIVFVAVLLFAACARDGVTIYAPAACAGGAVFVDGAAKGHLSETQREYRWLGWGKTKKELSSPPRSETSMFLSGLSIGKHRLRIETTGYEPIEVTFESRAEATSVEIDDSMVVEVKKAASDPGS
jgi:hypothetical protein